ncbi:hypothetical protein FQN50_001289 [Emmonsiellopsis sp. PD_5]|nr:hypothetical protein FQN50_001289 [Emmonsiellopsis sp. PD_5]
MAVYYDTCALPPAPLSGTDTQVGTPVPASDRLGGEKPQFNGGESALTEYDKVNPALFPPTELFQICPDLKGEDRYAAWFNIAISYLYSHVNRRVELYQGVCHEDLSPLDKEVFGLLGDMHRELDRIARLYDSGLGSVKFETFSFQDMNGKLARFQDVFAQDTDGREMSFWGAYHRLTSIDAQWEAGGCSKDLLRLFEKPTDGVQEPCVCMVNNAVATLATRFGTCSAEVREAAGALFNLSRSPPASPLESSTAAEDSPGTVGWTPSPTSSPSRKRKEPAPAPAPSGTATRRSKRVRCHTRKLKESKGAVEGWEGYGKN